MMDEDIERRALEAYHNDPVTSSEEENDSDVAEMEIETAAEPSGLETSEIVLPMIVVAVQMYSDVAVIEVKPAAAIRSSFVGRSPGTDVVAIASRVILDIRTPLEAKERHPAPGS